MNNVSVTGVGLVGVVVYVIIAIGKYFNIDIAEAELTVAVQNVIGVVGFVAALIGQIKRKDLKAGLIRR